MKIKLGSVRYCSIGSKKKSKLELAYFQKEKGGNGKYVL